MNSLLALVTWAVKIPDVIWSGLLAAGITLFGVILANMQNARRQTQQHRFDADESRQERRHEVRKEVYLPLAAAIVEVQAALSQLQNSHDAALKPLGKMGQASSKLSLVAETSTVVLAVQTHSEFLVAYNTLLVASDTAREAKNALDQAKSNQQKSKKRAKDLREKIEKWRLLDYKDGKAIKQFEEEERSYIQAANDFGGEHAEFSKQHAKRTFAYLRLLIEKLPGIVRSYAKLMIALRVDMDITTDELKFLSAYDEQAIKMTQELERILKHYENHNAELDE